MAVYFAHHRSDTLVIQDSANSVLIMNGIPYRLTIKMASWLSVNFISHRLQEEEEEEEEAAQCPYMHTLSNPCEFIK